MKVFNEGSYKKFIARDKQLRQDAEDGKDIEDAVLRRHAAELLYHTRTHGTGRTSRTLKRGWGNVPPEGKDEYGRPRGYDPHDMIIRAGTFGQVLRDLGVKFKPKPGAVKFYKDDED